MRFPANFEKYLRAPVVTDNTFGGSFYSFINLKVRLSPKKIVLFVSMKSL